MAAAVATMIGGLLALPVQPAAAAPSPGGLRLQARIDGRTVGDGRLVIDPSRTANMVITVGNDTGSTQRVKTVRLSGTALALTFFAYDTAVAFDVPAGETVTRSFPLDLADLDRQATGLLPSSLRLLGPDRAVLAEVDATSDVRGSVWSVYGVFGITVVIVTLLAWAVVLVALAAHRLPANPWRRAVHFLPAGVGTGLSAVLTLSVLRLVPPTPAAEIPLVLGCAAAALALGYLTSYPGDAFPPSDDLDYADYPNYLDDADHADYPEDLDHDLTTDNPPPSVVGEPAPSVPGEPPPSVVGEPAPSAPGEPAPSVPDEPAPSVPDEPAPSVPGEPAPSVASAVAAPALGDNPSGDDVTFPHIERDDVTSSPNEEGSEEGGDGDADGGAEGGATREIGAREVATERISLADELLASPDGPR